MVAYRTGYGTGAYSAQAYGLDGEILDLFAVASPVSTATTSIVAQVQLHAQASVQSSTTVNTGNIFTASAHAVASATITASIELKWNSASPQAETWTAQTAAEDIWVPATTESETWVQAA